MPIYKIAGINVLMNPKYKTLSTQSEKYICDESRYDFEIDLSDDFLHEKIMQYPHLSIDDCEYIYYGSCFYENCLDYNRILLHSSAVALNGNAYVFSAPSGTGKSTHVSLWTKNFKDAVVINDDKPAIGMENDKFYVFGTPFSGKTDINENVKVPLKAICILDRSKTNTIEKVSPASAVLPILNQTLRPEDKMDKLMAFLTKLLKTVPVYRLYCNMDDEAAFVSYNEMRKDF